MIKIETANGVKVPFELIKFPDGHRHFRLADDVAFLSSAVVTIRIRTFDDLFVLKQAVKNMRNLSKDVVLHLKVVYLLAARFDRPMVAFDSFDLQIVAEYINEMNFNSVSILEPHSQVSLALINNSYTVSPLDEAVKQELTCYQNTKTLEYDCCFVVPDLGAVKRLEHLLKGHGQVNIVYSNKTRNLKTGEITGIEILNPDKLLPNVIIFDDLCDGGRTFTELAKVLRPRGVKRIILAVTHGIFSKGLNVLVQPNDEGSYLDRIITTNSYSDQAFERSKLRVVEVI